MMQSAAGSVNRRPVTEVVRLGIDRLSETGAAALARGIEAYWHSQGHRQVRAWAQPVAAEFGGKRSEATSRMVVWVVRTNLVGGLPPE
jgi:hypothetical protein